MVKDFHQLHNELFTFSLPWVPIELKNLRLTAKVKSTKIPINKIDAGTRDPSKALKNERQCYFDGTFIKTPVYDGFALKGGNVIPGPAIVEEPTSTVVIPSAYTCTFDDYGNYVMNKKT
jgi:N-methylhydantoinase A